MSISIVFTMKGMGERIIIARKKMGYSQQDLAKVVKVHFTNIGKYEREEAIPSADVLNRIAKAMDVNTDFLLNGTMQDKAKNNIKDDELLMQFKKVELLPNDKKKLIKEFLDAFLFKDSIQQQFNK
jgi:transcriptional regulator with XRE-family HTH domain